VSRPKLIDSPTAGDACRAALISTEPPGDDAGDARNAPLLGPPDLVSIAESGPGSFRGSAGRRADPKDDGGDDGDRRSLLEADAGSPPDGSVAEI
jgi:hypothetical protein